MRILLIRRGQELEVAKALLGSVEETNRNRAQEASDLAGITMAQRRKAAELFQKRLAEMQAAHDRRMAEMVERESSFDAQARELKGQAKRVRDAVSLL
jgi:hypothetical protein